MRILDAQCRRDGDDRAHGRPPKHDDFDDVDPATALDDVFAYERELAQTREDVTAWTDLDSPVRGLRRGEQVNLRWIIVQLVEEDARHLGHMDLLREATDDSTGD